MAKPNYSFEKRQREIAKKKKKDAKAARKREAREAGPPADESNLDRTRTDGPDAEVTAASAADSPRIHLRTGNTGNNADN